ncbi:MAG: polysaccharide pyruvyl transferase family protein [Acidimicrobiales bacterium]
MTTLTHVGIHESLNRNAGDTLLFEEVRRLFDRTLGPVEWNHRQLWEHLDRPAAAALNQEGHGLVVGGGGLLLRDQAGADASASGWQWNSTAEAIRDLEVPLVIFAIGYNRFRNQPEFDDVFAEHLTAVVEQAGFVGLRNRGSIEAVGRYLPASLRDRLVLQQCPTCVLWQLHDDVPPTVIDHRRSGRRLLRFNVAFDRPEMRFGDQAEVVLDRLARAMHHAGQSGWEVRVTCHKELDLQILPYLDAVGARYQVDDLTMAGSSDIIDAYARCDLAVGLRGHAQMVPFGMRVPILSVISHDKMGWLLDDIGHPEWGVEVGDPALVDEICDRIDHQSRSADLVHEQLAVAQEAVWDRTVSNMETVAVALGQTAHDTMPTADGEPPNRAAVHQ